MIYCPGTRVTFHVGFLIRSPRSWRRPAPESSGALLLMHYWEHSSVQIGTQVTLDYTHLAHRACTNTCYITWYTKHAILCETHGRERTHPCVRVGGSVCVFGGDSKCREAYFCLSRYLRPVVDYVSHLAFHQSSFHSTVHSCKSFSWALFGID